ncbi:DMT family transporter [Microterricola viridarii]|uniref:Transporter family-2 protein n=1 Tax=Microterricola viridarii TaxID=412690 RepID=A0A1H1YKT0_9MICO|nr:DMT family transporter [Microterricola viridarii]SDT22022.1 transporter family-2 protein [Microterricola viridarii]
MTASRMPTTAESAGGTPARPDSGAPTHRHVPTWLAMLVGTACGALIALQSRINGELGLRLDDGFTAAAISFGSGFLIMFVVLCFWRPGRAGLARVVQALRRNEQGERVLRPWMVLGGLGGALLVASQGLTAAVLGVALFTVAIVAGQTVSGLVLDRIGLGPGGRQQLTLSRLIGSVLTLVAVGWAVSAQLGGEVPIWMLVMPLVAGVFVGWQQAVNGRVRAVAGSALSATLINFLIGSIALVAIALVHNVLAGWPSSYPSEPWLYIGGALGCIFIAVQAALVRVTGVLLLGLATIAGQLIAALAIDLVLHGQDIALSTIAGTALALVAVVIASGGFARRR